MKLASALITTAAIALLSGCAQMGPTADKAGNVVGGAFDNVVAFNAKMGQRIGGTIAGVTGMEDWTSGTEVTPEQLDTFKNNSTTQQQIISAIGHPPTREKFNGREVWKYHFTRIPHGAGKNISEDTVFEFNKNGTLHSAYKTAGTKGKSGNALLDAAGH